MKPAERMKTVTINGVPYRMRGDMKLPEWRKSTSKNDYHHGCANDPFRDGHRNYLTTPASCTRKREKFGDGVTFDRWSGKSERFDVVEEQIELELEYDL